MLVDNGVVGDSRVQKQAQSAAAQGFDVVLIGRGPKARRWKIGDARVRLLPFPGVTQARPHELRPAWLRRPLAYSSGAVAAQRETLERARRSDLDARLAQAAVEGSAARRTVLRTRLTASKATGRWVRLRSREAHRVAEARRSLTAPVDRMTTAFWRAALRDRAWQRLDPQLLEFEAVYGPVLDQLRPDIIHANDFRMLGVGARAVQRARARGRDVKLVWDAHEFLPGMRPWDPNPRWHPAQILHERQYAAAADAVVTVTEPLATWLVDEHGLAHRPAVVLNAPLTQDLPEVGPDATIRAACGLAEDVPLLVYCGAAAEQRGLATMVEGLADLPGVHTALVVKFPPNGYVRDLEARATELGVRDRLHVLPYVAVEEIVPFLRSADIGVIPMHRVPNHDVSLPTKFFEFSLAGLPILTSDTTAMAEVVGRTRQGEVFTAEDTAGYVAAVRMLLADPARYAAAYDDQELLQTWTWEHQATVLESVYSRVLGDRDRGR